MPDPKPNTLPTLFHFNFTMPNIPGIVQVRKRKPERVNKYIIADGRGENLNLGSLGSNLPGCRFQS